LCQIALIAVPRDKYESLFKFQQIPGFVHKRHCLDAILCYAYLRLTVSCANICPYGCTVSYSKATTPAPAINNPAIGMPVAAGAASSAASEACALASLAAELANEPAAEVIEEKFSPASLVIEAKLSVTCELRFISINAPHRNNIFRGNELTLHQ
jgi:hypothetical protein